MAWRFPDKYRDEGLLLLRIGIGVMFVVHGLPKLIGGPARWEQVGRAMVYLGVDFLPTFWGFCAATTETVGGLFLLLGLFFRPACLLLAFTMTVAANMHFGRGDGLLGASHAIESCILFLSLFLIGPGSYRLRK
ncbi:MAG: DoxX family protein [Desulfuromonas sp.]|nr:MAG: DoxX family protein [Desulfuromonas sp.]